MRVCTDILLALVVFVGCPVGVAVTAPGRNPAAGSGARVWRGLRFAPAAAAAQARATRVKIVRDKTLSKDLVYWFAAPSLPASARRPLPQAGLDGAVFVDVPPAYDKPSAQIKVLDGRKGLLARVPIRDSSGRLAGNLLGPNLLQNSEFARDGEHWVQELSGGEAKGQLEWLGGAEMPKGVSGNAMRVKVLATDKVNWHVQFHQMGLDLVDNEPYTLTFWARADRARPLSVNATIDKDDYHWIGLSNQVALTTEWRKFSLIFTATRTLQSHNRLGFVLGDAVGAVDMAGISLQRGVAAGPPGANLLRNSAFTHGTEGWTISAADPAKAVTKSPSEIPVPPGAQGKAVQIDVTQTGAQNWYVQFFQTGIDLTEDEPLTLSFWAKSNRPRPLSVIVGEDKEDFHTVGLDNTALLQITWRKFVYVFTATRTVRKSHRLTFLMGDNTGEVDLAAVMLQPGAEAMVEPGGGLETVLSASDFKYAQSVSVPVRYRGKAVEDLAVTLKYRDESVAVYKIQPTDRGSAHFADVPVDEKITVLVSDGAQSAEFPRIVASDAPGALAAVEVPATWTQVKTSKDAAGEPLPIVGRWESQASQSAERYVTTFNADGTGTIKRVSAGSASEGPVTAPPSGAFLWHVTNGDRAIVMGSREYTWSVSGTGKTEKLVLKDAKGSLHTLYRR